MAEDKNLKANLTVITVNWHSMEFLEPLFTNLNKKAKWPRKIKYFVIDNTNCKDKQLPALKHKNLNLTIYPNDPKGEKGSSAHALGLNTAMDKLETEYGLIVDPDIHIFKNNWDSLCIDIIENQGCSVVGATYPQWQLGKYHNFPNPVFCFFKTDDYKTINADWTAYSKSPLINFFNFCRRQILRLGILINRRRYQKYPAVRKMFGFLEHIIGVCSNDTGSRIASKAKRNNMKAILFQAVLPDDEIIAGKSDSFINLAEQFELYCYNKEPVLTHRYGSASKIWKTQKGKDTLLWRKCIEELESEIAKSLK